MRKISLIVLFLGFVFCVASCSMIEYALHFETNGGDSIESVVFRKVDEVSALPTPTRSGYTFDGWYMDESLTQAITKVVDKKNITIYAKWLKNITVTFHNTSEPVYQTVEGYLTGLPTPEREDYYFVGWYKDGACTIPLDIEQTVHDNLTLYAKWIDVSDSKILNNIDFFELRLGKTYKLGLSELPTSVQAEYEITFSSNLFDIEEIIQKDGYEFKVVGTGIGQVKVEHKKSGEIIYDNSFGVDETFIVSEINRSLKEESIIENNERFMMKSELAQLKKLEVLGTLETSKEELVSLSLLSSLETLIINENDLSNLDFIEPLSNLKHLDVSHNKITDISGVNKLSKLVTLNISSNEIKSLPNFNPNGFLNLKAFDVSHNEISDIRYINNLIYVEELNLGYNQISNIAALSNLYNLKKLNISALVYNANTMDNIRNIEQLEMLNISDVKFDFDDLPELENLKELHLVNTTLFGQKAHLESLSLYPNLEILNLSSNWLEDEDFDLLKSNSDLFKNVHTLILNDNEFIAVPDLTSLTNLKHLSLAENENMYEIHLLSGLDSIETLNLDYSGSIMMSYQVGQVTYDFRHIVDDMQSLKKLSMVGSLQFIDKTVHTHLVEKIEGSNEKPFELSLFEDTWISLANVNQFKETFYFSIEDLLEDAKVTDQGIVLPYRAEFGRKIMINFSQDMYFNMEALFTKFIIPYELTHVSFVGASNMMVIGMSIVVNDRKSSNINIELYNMKMKAWPGDHAISSEGQNPVTIYALGKGNQLYGGDQMEVGTKPGHGIYAHDVRIILPIQHVDEQAMLNINGGSAMDLTKGSKGCKVTSLAGAKGGNGIYARGSVYLSGIGHVDIRGGKGGAGQPGANGDKCEGNKGGAGGAGGNGILAAKEVHLLTNNLIIIAGNGGRGGAGGNGDLPAWTTAIRGGDGGNGGSGGHAILGEDLYLYEYVLTDIYAKAGVGANGGNGGNYDGLVIIDTNPTKKGSKGADGVIFLDLTLTP